MAPTCFVTTSHLTPNTYTETVLGIRILAFILLFSFTPSYSLSSLNLTYSQWILQPTPLIPTPSDGKSIAGASIGYSSTHNKIYLIGGQLTQRLLEYDVTSDAFLNYGDYWLQQPAKSLSQYYSQLDDYLYMITSPTPSFMRFNTNTKTIDYGFDPIPRSVLHDGACLASTHDDKHKNHYLWILGRGIPSYSTDGGSPSVSKTVQVLNLTDHSWLPAVQTPPMNINRSEFACTINGYVGNGAQLYAIGGHGGYDANDAALHLNTVEVLDVSNMHKLSTQSWRILTDRLPHFMYATTAVNYLTDVLIIGGVVSTTYPNDISVIDTVTNSISVKGHLPTNQFFGYNVPCVIVDHTVYAFSTISGQIWRLSLPTRDPTVRPTGSPSALIPTTQKDVVEPSKEKQDLTIWIVIGVAVIVIVCAVLCVCKFFKKKKTKEKEQVSHDHLRKMYHVPDVMQGPQYLPQTQTALSVSSKSATFGHKETPSYADAIRQKSAMYTYEYPKSHAVSSHTSTPQQAQLSNPPLHNKIVSIPMAALAVQTAPQTNTAWNDSDSDSDLPPPPPPVRPPANSMPAGMVAQPPPPPSNPPPMDNDHSSSDESVYQRQREFLQEEIKERASLQSGQ